MMERLLQGDRHEIKCKKLIVCLLVVELFCLLLTSPSCFASYYFSGDDDIADELHWGFRFLGCISLISAFAPVVLLLLYVLGLNGKEKGHIIVPTVYAWYIVQTFFYNFLSFLFLVVGGKYGSDWWSFGRVAILQIGFAMATYSSFKGLSNKLFVAIPTVLGIAFCLLSLPFEMIDNLERHTYLYLFTDPVGSIGTVSWYTALLVFGLKNTIPVIRRKRDAKAARMEELGPTEALLRLNEERAKALITEEEYQVRRAEIISRL